MTITHQPIRKSFAGVHLKAAVEENTITVVASTTGNPDRSGDVIAPGAFGPGVTADFVSNGFVAIGHDWDDLPVAMPTSCVEQGGELTCSATFHSTEEGQNARTVCKERMDAGKSVSLSVGFMPDYSDPDGVVWFDKGSDLIAWATGKGMDMSLFDVKAILKLGFCRIITKIAELFEWSIVCVGMNRKAKAIAAKGHTFSGPARLVWQCGKCQEDNDQTVVAGGKYLCKKCGELPHKASSELKSLANTVSALLQAKIHQSFTVAADELAIRGYMDTPERIALSSSISNCLQLFAATIDPEVGERDVAADDVDWVASKSFEGKTFDEQFNEALGCLDSTLARWEGIAEKRETLGDSHRAKLSSLVSRLELIAAKSEPAPEPEEDSDETVAGSAKEAAFRALTYRMLSHRTAA